MRNIYLIFAAIIALSFGCNQTTNKNNTTGEDTVQQTNQQEEPVKYETVELVLQNADSLSGKKVNVKGIVEHVCKHGGKRFKILSTDGSIELKIELEDLKAVDNGILGNTAKVTGILTSTQMDEKMVKAWKEKMKKNHKGEEKTEHYKQELSKIQNIYNQIVSGEIPYYTAYSVYAEKYVLE